MTAAEFGGREDHREAPALLGLSPRQLHPSEVLAWRQDWGVQDIDPLSTGASRTVRKAFAIPA